MNTNSEILDIIYCLDENYNLQMSTSANSFLKYYNEPVRIHILHNNPDSLSTTLSPLKNNKSVISLEKYKFTKFDNFIFPKIENRHVSEATYYRLFLQDFLPKNIKNLLYLDPDVITMNKVKDVIKGIFNNLSKSKFSIAGVNYTKSINSSNKEMLERLKMNSTKYFNAGVLFIDYEKWIDQNIGSNILTHAKSMLAEVELVHHDQDVLNSYFDGKFLELDNKFNWPILEQFYYKDKEVIENQTFFIHYVGKEKPWLLNGIFTNIAKYYQENFEHLYSKKHIVFDKNLNLKSQIKNILGSYPVKKGKIRILLQVIKEYFLISS